MMSCVKGQTSCLDPNKLDMFGLINVLYLKADNDRDGIITLPELETIWDAFDQNGDQVVTPAEFVPSWAALTSMSTEMSTAYFDLADFDDNGQVTSSDIQQMYNRFDMDGNGNITAQEFNLKWQQIYREAPFAVLFLRADTSKDDNLQKAEFGHLFSSLTNNSDGAVTQSDFESGWATLACDLSFDADIIFYRLDTNNDKVLMPSEMEHQFSQYDTNHNGNVELLELVSILVRLYPTTGS